MSNQNLINSINALITENGANEITGAVLNAVLNAVVGYFADNFGGVITPSSLFTQDEDKKWWFMASANGVYTDFGGIELSEEICIISYDGTFVKHFIAEKSKGILNVSTLEAPFDRPMQQNDLVMDTSSGKIYQLLESATDTQTLDDVDKTIIANPTAITQVNSDATHEGLGTESDPLSWVGAGASLTDDELIKVAADGKTVSRVKMTATDDSFNLKNFKPGFNIGSNGDRTGAYDFSLFAFTHYKIRLIGDVDITFTNIPDLQSFTISIQVVQDATGGRNLTFAAEGITFINTQEFDFSEGGADEECYVTMRFYGNKCRYLVDKYV